LRVIDGDTIHVKIDLGMRVFRETSVRIAGIDAPELRSGTEEERVRGAAAGSCLRDLLLGDFDDFMPVYLRTHKDATTFDRYLADVFVKDDDGALLDVGEAMVQAGHAVRREG
jgi:micrococcal nuclease